MGTEQRGIASGLREHDANMNNVTTNPQGAECFSPGFYIYRQDVVKNNNSGLIGFVTEVAGDSDSDSSTSDEDDEEDDEDEDYNVDEGDVNKEDNHVTNKRNVNKGDGGDKSISLEGDQIRVFCTDDTQTIQRLTDITVTDRAFLHGDIVASASDPTGQVGVVVDINISVDLFYSNECLMKDVSSKDLKRIRDFTVGDYVVLGPWLGRIDDVLDNVTVLFDDGSICKVLKTDTFRLKPVNKNALDDGHSPFYPGQRVRVSSKSVLKSTTWVSGPSKANQMEGTVTKVTVGSVFIYWITPIGYGPNSSDAPAEEQSPKNLKLLSCFSHANWRLCDWCLFPSLPSSSVHLVKGLSKLEPHISMNGDVDTEATLEESPGHCEFIDLHIGVMDETNGSFENNFPPAASLSSDSLLVSKEPIREIWPAHRKKIRKGVVRRDKKIWKKEENFERALFIGNTKTRVNVAWQDGNIEYGMESRNLIPIDNPGDHEFIAEQYVIEKVSADNDDDSCEVGRAGIVKTVNAKERTACVRWLKAVTRAEDPREFDKEEVVSVYELDRHPDYDYCCGDLVVRLYPVPVYAQTNSPEDSTEPPKQQTAGIKHESVKPVGFNNEENASGVGGHMELSDLSWVGNITSLKDGDIEVTWADGMVSTVGPQAVYVVARDDDESIGISDDGASWETVNDDDMDALESAEEHGPQEITNLHSEADDIIEFGDNISERHGPLSIPLAALGFVTKLATGIFSRGRNHVDPTLIDVESEYQSQGSDGSTSHKSIIIDNCESGDGGSDYAHVKKSKILFNVVEPDIRIEEHKDVSNFKRFDTATDPLDHYFMGSNGQSNNGRKWLKKVQQDWSILQYNLPDGIYVRVYEDRMDLLRAVIVGAYGTPYQDGLFFFDFHLPPEYPVVPPSAHYHSGGWRVNPNLYEEGKVCLSLLNTWTGRGNEVWDPFSSSILQVLVSLQGLVLNSKPYFNEAGYDKQIGTAEGEKNSLSYNENTFLLSCKTMMYLMRKPPKDFEELIKEHFRRRGYHILKACDVYKQGYSIGSLTNDAVISKMSNVNATSVGFKLMLAKIVPKLYSALNEAGANCGEFQHLL